MIQDCKYNPASDFEETVPELAADVSELMATHVVIGGPNSSIAYSNETDVNNVGHYLRDKIQTFMAAQRLGNSMAAVAAAQKERQPATGE